MAFSIFTRVLFLGAVLGLSACGGGGSGSGTPDREVSVSGKVLNGPLSGAEVSVFDASGALLGTGVTTVDGDFSIAVTNPESPLRLVSQGGELAGVPYLGTLRADCELLPESVSVTCSLTPYSTLAASMVDSGLTVAEAAAQLFDVFRLGEDPFVQDADNPGSVLSYKFDLDSARAAIGDGSGLTAWLGLMQDWVEAVVAWIDEVDAGNEDAVIVGTPPAGTPVYRIQLQLLTAGGTADPAYVDIPMGGQAQFNVLPDATYVVSNISGCGGSLDGTVYTTAVIASVGDVSGVCTVRVSFALEQFDLTYIAGADGSIEGAASQQISYGSDGTAVTAKPIQGYKFVSWDDGVLTATRTDQNVTADISVTASFEIEEYTLTYNAGDNGQLSVEDEFGNPVFVAQVIEQVLFQGAGPTVTAVPDAGYRFVRWDPSSSTNPRTDFSVAGNITATAIFEPTPEATPWQQSLHNGDLEVQILGPTRAALDWPVTVGVSYDLYISPVADLVIDQYAAFGGTLVTDVTPPYVLDMLSPGQPVYVAVEADGAPFVWSSFVPRTWGVDGQVLAQDFDQDGNRYIGGEFGEAVLNLRAATTLAPSGNYGQAHPLVFPDVDGVVHAIVDDGEGGWYIGGEFSRVGGLPRQNLARIDKSGQVADWEISASGAGGAVYALSRFSTSLVVGGDFAYAEGASGGAARASLAAFDGDGDLIEQFSPEVTGSIRTLLFDGSTLYIGGTFSAVDGLTRSGIALINSFGQVLPWQSQISGNVYSIAKDGSRIVVAGDFEEILVDEVPTPRSLLAVFDQSGAPLDFVPEFSGPAEKSIFSLMIDNGNLLVGGRFDMVDGQPRGGFAAFDDQGALMETDVAVDGAIHSLTVSNQLMYVGGDFLTATGANGAEQRQGVAVFDGSYNLLDWNPRLSGSVAELFAGNDVVAVAGELRGVSAELPRLNLAAFDQDGELLSWAPAADGAVNTLAVGGDTVYLGGAFTQLGNLVADTSRPSLGAVDRLTGAVAAWNPSTDGEVSALLVDAGVIYFAGSFSEAGALLRQNLAAADVSGLVQSWNPGSNGSVSALLADSGVIYAGGSFTAAGGGTADTTRLNLAAFDPAGNLLAWDPGADGNVASLTSLNGDIYAGGAFLNAGGGTADTGRAYLAAFDSAGNLLGWNPGANAAVTSLSADTAIYAAGGFSEVGSAIARQGIAAFDGAGLVLDWNPGAVLDVRSILAANGLIAVAGAFDRVGSAEDISDDPRAGLAVFDDTGALLSR